MRAVQCEVYSLKTADVLTCCIVSISSDHFDLKQSTHINAIQTHIFCPVEQPFCRTVLSIRLVHLSIKTQDLF